MSRYLDVRAAGLLQWLAQPEPSPARRVLTGLLALPRSAELVPARLAPGFGLDLPTFARALFALNRSGSVQVSTDVRDHRAECQADHRLLCDDLGQLASPAAVLAGDDGLCLAQHGLSAQDGLRQAALCHRGPSPAFPVVVPLHLGQRTVRLSASTPIDETDPALLRLARRLLSLQTPVLAPA